MDRYFIAGKDSSSSAGDESPTIFPGSGSGYGSSSGSGPNPLSRSRHRLPAASVSPPTAFLGPAFNACARSPVPYADSDLSYGSRPPLPGPDAARRFLRTRSPAAAYRAAPLKLVDVEEDVLVMDEVLVNDSKRIDRRNNSPANLFGPGANFSGGGSNYRKDMRPPPREELGMNLYCSKYQFAPGKDPALHGDFSHLGGARYSKKQDEVVGDLCSMFSAMGSPALSPQSYPCVSPSGPKTPRSVLRFEDVIASAPAPAPAPAPQNPPPLSSTPPPLTLPQSEEEEAAANQSVSRPSSEANSKLLFSLPSRSEFTWPPTKEEDALITQFLNRPRTHRRLPVFEDICPSK